MMREAAKPPAPRHPSGIRRLGAVVALTAGLCLGPMTGLVASGAVASAQTVGDRSATSSSTDRADPAQSAADGRDLAVIVALGTGFVMIAGGKAYRLRRLQQRATRGTPDEAASSA